MRLVFSKGTDDISKAIAKATDSKWSHVGMLMNHSRYVDFSHDRQVITDLSSVVGEYEIVYTDIISHNATEHLYSLFQLAEYDVPAVIDTYKKMRRGGRDSESVQSHPFKFTCSNMITHVIENTQKKKLFGHHWSQATPEDLWLAYTGEPSVKD